ncbi:MAG: RloB family protein [Bacteroidales bacterium]|jgi:hypothetical protein|nr:RloB family protein [Bacteroidales bacterium]
MRSYEKSHPEKSTLEQKQQSNDTGIVTSSFTVKDAGRNYKKEDGVKSPKSFIVIVSGGEVRERNYFIRISNENQFKRIKLDFVAAPRQAANYLDRAIYKQEYYASSQEDEPDRIYIVSDVDNYMNDLLNIKPKCEQRGIHLIISNPCFEIWLYYGKFNGNPVDFNIPQDNSKISQAFKTYLGQKVKGGVNPKNAIFDINDAIKNTKSVYQEDTNGIPNLFSTNMFRLAEDILPFIDSEVKRMINEKNQKETEHKNALNPEN